MALSERGLVQARENEGTAKTRNGPRGRDSPSATPKRDELEGVLTIFLAFGGA